HASQTAPAPARQPRPRPPGPQFPGFPLELAQPRALIHGQRRFLAGLLTAAGAQSGRRGHFSPRLPRIGAGTSRFTPLFSSDPFERARPLPVREEAAVTGHEPVPPFLHALERSQPPVLF